MNCCQCGGQGTLPTIEQGEAPDSCYHCQTEGTCNCRLIECEVCGDTGKVLDEIFEVEVDFPGQDRYHYTYKECLCATIGAKDKQYKEVRD